MSSEDYPYPLLDEKGKLVCQLCGKSFLVISPKHLANHDIRYSEYKLRFPDAPLSTSEFAASSRYGRVKNIFDDEIIVEDEIYDIDSEFEGIEDPEKQTEVTIHNIQQLYSCDVLANICTGNVSPYYGHARVYLKNKEDYKSIKQVFERYYGRLPVVYIQADICREDLLVEI